MAREIKWTEAAWNDLEEVADYIQKDSPYYAASFVREVKDAARSLTSLAERGRIVPEFENPSIREIFIKKYRLIYQIKNHIVSLVCFIHGARDLIQFWEREERFTL